MQKDGSGENGLREKGVSVELFIGEVCLIKNDITRNVETIFV